MNLIEQLGGYENVSKHFNRVEYHAETKIFIGEWFGFYSMRDLKDALLEYRRQHNIFEESDKIVFVDDFMHGELMTVAWTRKGEVWMDNGAKRCTDLSMIRHATDAEIKAGNRL